MRIEALTMQNYLFGLQNKKYWMLSIYINIYIYRYFWVRVKYGLAIFLRSFLGFVRLYTFLNSFVQITFTSADLKVTIKFCMTTDSMTSLPVRLVRSALSALSIALELSSIRELSGNQRDSRVVPDLSGRVWLFLITTPAPRGPTTLGWYREDPQRSTIGLNSWLMSLGRIWRKLCL